MHRYYGKDGWCPLYTDSDEHDVDISSGGSGNTGFTESLGSPLNRDNAYGVGLGGWGNSGYTTDGNHGCTDTEGEGQ